MGKTGRRRSMGRKKEFTLIEKYAGDEVEQWSYAHDHHLQEPSQKSQQKQQQQSRRRRWWRDFFKRNGDTVISNSNNTSSTNKKYWKIKSRRVSSEDNKQRKWKYDRFFCNSFFGAGSRMKHKSILKNSNNNNKTQKENRRDHGDCNDNGNIDTVGNNCSCSSDSITVTKEVLRVSPMSTSCEVTLIEGSNSKVSWSPSNAQITSSMSVVSHIDEDNNLSYYYNIILNHHHHDEQFKENGITNEKYMDDERNSSSNRKYSNNDDDYYHETRSNDITHEMSDTTTFSSNDFLLQDDASSLKPMLLSTIPTKTTVIEDIVSDGSGRSRGRSSARDENISRATYCQYRHITEQQQSKRPQLNSFIGRDSLLYKSLFVASSSDDDDDGNYYFEDTNDEDDAAAVRIDTTNYSSDDLHDEYDSKEEQEQDNYIIKILNTTLETLPLECEDDDYCEDEKNEQRYEGKSSFRTNNRSAARDQIGLPKEIVFQKEVF